MTNQTDPIPPELGYGTLFLRFLRFGVLAFGGPVAQIAMIRRELVDEEQWIGSAGFNKLLAVMQALPGPEAHELCVHLGIRAKGRIGGVLAGLGFMLPGFVLMLALAWLYTRLPIDHTLLGGLFVGVQAAVLAVIVRAVHRIGEHILLDPWLWVVAAGSAITSLVGVTFWIVLPTAGVTYALIQGRRKLWALALLGIAAAVSLAVFSLEGGQLVTPVGTATTVPATAAALFFAGLKGGLLTFGGAYTAIPFVRDDTVGRGWLSDNEFLDGLALSGVLPAPLVIFVTFIGWVSGGLAGALAITAGMFLPAFAFSLVFYERLEGVADNKRLQMFLSGVAASVVGIITITLLDLAQAGLRDTPHMATSLAIFAVALAVMYRWKSKLATPAAMTIGALAGVFALN
uniref:chromate efflux transporter n=1 Tax=Porphyrobacter sp. GA68 TaxID=2883480 RepID=UPI001D185475|nr:chromate efflux transporter [Porphyrobacter sp. GA68]